MSWASFKGEVAHFASMIPEAVGWTMIAIAAIAVVAFATYIVCVLIEERRYVK